MTTRDHILAAMAKAPTLTTGGFMPKNHPDQNNRLDDMVTPYAMEQFETACRFIEAAGITQHWSKRSPSSYGLKHTAERWADTYIPNGVFIAAAIHMGAPVQRCEGTSPNAYIGLKKSGLNALARDSKKDHDQ